MKGCWKWARMPMLRSFLLSSEKGNLLARAGVHVSVCSFY